MVTIKRSLDDVIDDWNNAEYWRVINVKTMKIEQGYFQTRANALVFHK